MKKSIGVILVLLAVLFATGCGSTVSSAKRDNFAYIYGRGPAQLRLNARVYHSSMDHSTVYYKLNTKDLLYKSDGSGGPFRAVVRITYEAYADWNTRTLLDSASTLVQDKSEDTDEDKELIGSMDLRRKDQRSFVLKVMARDLNRDNESTVFLRVERDGESTRQYFMPVDTAKGLPLFDDHRMVGGSVRVRSEVFAGRTLWGQYFSATDQLPTPVFTTGGGKASIAGPDSTFTINVPEDGNFLMELEKAGTYHLRADTTTEMGYTLFSLAESYPYVGTAEDMLRPMRYITSLQEYDRISKSPNVRQAIERFWIDAAGERERAREAIRIYYGRVENANRHFTSTVEGWRTDRGLVHIIFGIPNSIYKSDLSETWIYGEENNLMSLTFTFVKRSGPHSENDLVLERDPLLKGAWYRNVESWRNGRVYQN
ncbi:MAG: GWxTD domain-containing protein [Flavobacteriales bacterium]|nr:GWxTD domain-containing protein [Flavobacteriales bacterium]